MQDLVILRVIGGYHDSTCKIRTVSEIKGPTILTGITVLEDSERKVVIVFICFVLFNHDFY